VWFQDFPKKDILSHADSDFEHELIYYLKVRCALPSNCLLLSRLLHEANHQQGSTACST
jgi:hypothetical protein